MNELHNKVKKPVVTSTTKPHKDFLNPSEEAGYATWRSKKLKNHSKTV